MITSTKKDKPLRLPVDLGSCCDAYKHAIWLIENKTIISTKKFHRILDRISDQHRELLKSNLQYAHEYSTNATFKANVLALSDKRFYNFDEDELSYALLPETEHSPSALSKLEARMEELEKKVADQLKLIQFVCEKIDAVNKCPCVNNKPAQAHPMALDGGWICINSTKQ